MAGRSEATKKRVLMARDAVRLAESQGAEPDQTSFSSAPTVLIVTCDSARAGEVVGALQRRGFPSIQGSTAAQALYWARREPPGLVILDLRVDGWRRLLDELRGDRPAILALSDDLEARTQALEDGCIDAPLSGLDAEHVALKAAALLRRPRVAGTGRIAAGPLVVEPSARRLVWQGRSISVPPLVLRLAASLATHAGTLVPGRVLLEEVWGEPWADLSKVHQAVWRLRRYLGEPADSSFLVGRQGQGYGLVSEPASTIRARRRASGF